MFIDHDFDLKTYSQAVLWKINEVYICATYQAQMINYNTTGKKQYIKQTQV